MRLRVPSWYVKARFGFIRDSLCWVSAKQWHVLVCTGRSVTVVVQHFKKMYKLQLDSQQRNEICVHYVDLDVFWNSDGRTTLRGVRLAAAHSSVLLAPQQTLRTRACGIIVFLLGVLFEQPWLQAQISFVPVCLYALFICKSVLSCGYMLWYALLLLGKGRG